MGVPTTPVLDTFVRANEEPPTGWTDMADKPGLKIASNQLTGDSATYCAGYWSVVYTVPCEFYFTVADAIGGGETIEPIYLCADNGASSPIRNANRNGYTFLTHIPGANQIQVRRYDNGAFTATCGTFAWTIANGDTYLVRVNTLGLHTLYAKASAGAWTLLGSFTDTTYTSGVFLHGTGAIGTGALSQFGGGQWYGALDNVSATRYPRPVLRTV